MHTMLVLALVLFVAWILGFTVFHVASFLIHLLLIAAVIAAIVWVVRMAAGKSHHSTV